MSFRPPISGTSIFHITMLLLAEDRIQRNGKEHIRCPQLNKVQFTQSLLHLRIGNIRHCTTERRPDSNFEKQTYNFLKEIYVLIYLKEWHRSLCRERKRERAKNSIWVSHVGKETQVLGSSLMFSGTIFRKLDLKWIQ